MIVSGVRCRDTGVVSPSSLHLISGACAMRSSRLGHLSVSSPVPTNSVLSLGLLRPVSAVDSGAITPILPNSGSAYCLALIDIFSDLAFILMGIFLPG